MALTLLALSENLALSWIAPTLLQQTLSQAVRSSFWDVNRGIELMTQLAEINVTGIGKVRAMPDGIQIDMSVVSQKPNYPSTLANLNERVISIGEAIARAGTNEKLTTKSYAISEVWSNQHDDVNRKFQGYEAIQKLAVTIPADLDLLGRVVHELAEGGGQPSMGMTFVIRHTSAIEREARTTAALKAKEAAFDMAEASGLHLASVKSISYVPAKSKGSSSLVHINSLAQFDISPSTAVSPDAISFEETVHMVWLATDKPS